MTISRRYPLLLYLEWLRPLRLPSFLMALCLIGFWIAAIAGWIPIGELSKSPMPEALLALAAGVAVILWLVVINLPRMAYVELQTDYLLVRIGLLRLIVSYSRVRTSRSVQHGQIHHPAAQPGSRRALATRMALKQCIALELTSYPMAFFLLRALAHPFFFLGEEPGFLFAVEDWMGFGRGVEQARSNWLAKKRDSTKQPRLGGLLEG